MSLGNKLAGLREGIERGVFPDKHPEREGVWQDSRNVRFVEQGVQPIKGWWSKMTDANGDALPMTETMRGGFVSRYGNSYKGIVGNHERAYLIEFDSYSQISLTLLTSSETGRQYGTTAGPATFWSVVPWGSWLILTNGLSHFSYWNENGVGGIGVPGGERPRILVNTSAYVLGFNFPSEPNEVKWCTADDIQDWTPAPNNSAGDLIIREFSGEIKAAVSVGNRIAVFSETQQAMIDDVGAPYFFGYQIVPGADSGAYSQESVVAVGEFVYGLGRNGFFVTDGVSVTPLGRDSIWDTFKAELNHNTADLIHAYHDPEFKEVVWHYPTGTDLEPNKAIVYQYVLNAWSFRDMERSGSVGPKVYPHALGFHPDGTIYFQEIGFADVRFGYLGEDTVTSTVIPRWIQTKPMSFSSEEQSLEFHYKYVTAVQLQMQNYDGFSIKVSLGHQEGLYDSKTYWSDAYPYGTIYPLQSVRYGTLLIEEDNTNGLWTLQGFDIYGSIGGLAQ